MKKLVPMDDYGIFANKDFEGGELKLGSIS